MGTGDINIKCATMNIFSNNLQLEDLYKYISGTSEPTGANHGNLQVTYAENGMQITANTCIGTTYLSNILPDDFEASYIYNGGNLQEYTNEISIGYAHMEYYRGQINCGEYAGFDSSVINNKIQHSLSIGDKCTIKRIGNQLYYYINDVLINNHTLTYRNNDIYIWSCRYRSTIIKDLKIIEL